MWAGGNRYDDEIFEHTLREFPEFAAAPHTSLTKLDEEWMKSKEGKERWRAFINACVLSPCAFAQLQTSLSLSLHACVR